MDYESGPLWKRMSTNRMAKVTRLIPPRSTQLLGECRRLASARLPPLLKLLFDKTDDAYFELANKADSSLRQQLYFDAMREFRLQRHRLEQAFQTSINDGFEARAALPANRGLVLAHDASAELSLVGTDDVELNLAISNFAEAVEARCKQEWYALHQRISHLLSEPELARQDNPLGPKALGEALLAVSRLLDIHIEAKLTFLKLGDRCIGPGLVEIYRALNEFLVREDVLPKLHASHGRGGIGPRTRVTIETENGATSATGDDVFSTLQNLLRSGTNIPSLTSPGASTSSGTGLGFAATGSGSGSAHAGAGPHGGGQSAGGPGGTISGAGVGAGGIFGQSQAPGGVAPLTQLTTAAFITNLDDLQRGRADAVLNGVPELLQGGTVNVLRTLRDTGAIGELNQTDHVTLDIVTLLFDYILDDVSIPDRIKALIVRLQIPMLKVALLDKQLFSKKSHPARQLLDALAAASVGWSPGNAARDALFEKLQYIVYRVVEEFDKDIALFAELLGELTAFLDADERATASRAEKATESLRTKEKIVLAKMTVDEAVKSRLPLHGTRDFIERFVLDYWRQLLIVTFVEQGTDGPAWKEQLQAIDDLVWSVEAKQNADDKRELTTRLPKLLKTIKNGMRELQIPPAECAKFLTMLASVHVVSVKQVEEATLAERRIVQRDEERKTAAKSEEEFVKQALSRLFSRDTVQAHTETLDIDLSALEGEVSAIEVEPPVAEDEFLEKIMELDLGDWLEFTLEDDSTVRARFTWISPATGRYLFTDRLGNKAFDLSLNALQAQFRNSRVKRVASQPDPLFERAIGELLEKLERQVA